MRFHNLFIRSSFSLVAVLAALVLAMCNLASAETVTVNGMNDSTNYENVDIVDTLGKAAYTHKGTITGSSSLTINAPATNSNYRQWLGGADGSYTFTGPITVNGGQLLISTGTLKTNSINLNGGDMYVMYTDCLPHDAVINVGAGSMLDLESKANAIKGATINVTPGGSFRLAAQNLNDSAEPITLNIAGVGRRSSTYSGTYDSPGAIDVYGDKADVNLTANIHLTDDATISLIHMDTGKQLLIRGTLTGSSTATFSSDNAGRWIRLVAGEANNGLDMSGFSGNIVADNVKLRLFTTSLGTGSNITVQNSATAYFDNTAALNNYTGSFTVNGATIALEADGKLNNLSGDANGTVSYGAKALTLNNTVDTVFPGTLTGTGAVTKNGTGALTLTHNLSGVKVTSKAGTLVLGTANNEINIGSASVIKADGGAVRADGNIVVNSGYLSAGGTWTGDGSITVNAGGVLRASGTFTYPKGITLNGGILFNDGDNNSSAKAVVAAPITVTAPSSIQCGWSSNKSGEIDLTGGLHGSASLTVNSDSNMGWIYFMGEGDFTGTLNLKGKIVTGATGKGSAGSPASTTPYLGSGEIQLAGGLLLNNNSYWDVPNTINVVSNSEIRAGYDKEFMFSGNITGAGKLTVQNDNSWIILKTSSPDNSFTGDFQVNYSNSGSQGRVRFASDLPLGKGVGQGNIYGTLDMNGFSQVFKGLHADADKGPIYNNTENLSTLTIDTTSKDLTFPSSIRGNIALTITGDGKQSLSKAPEYTGATTVESGTLALLAGGTLYNLVGGSVNDDGSVAVAAAVDASGQALTIDNDVMTKFVGSIKAQSILKTGYGTLKIYADEQNKVVANTFTVSDSELDFKGYYEGDLEVINGAFFSPGNSVGEANIAGNIAFVTDNADSNGFAYFEFGDFTGADNNHDILVLGTGNLFTAVDGVVLLDFANDDAADWASAGIDYLLVANGAFEDGKDYTSWLTPTLTDMFSLQGRADGLYLIGLAGPGPEPGSGVPEPSTWALLVLGVIGLLLRKRVRS